MPVLALCWARWSEASIWVSWLRDRVSSSRSVRGEAKAGDITKKLMIIEKMVGIVRLFFNLDLLNIMQRVGGRFQLENESMISKVYFLL